MDSTEQNILAQIAKDQKLNQDSVKATIELLDGGNSVPFVTRYRKDKTGNLDYRQIQQIQFQLTKLRGIAERKSFIAKSIESQGKLTDELRQQIEQSDSIKEVEDLFLPFKSKKETAATVARQQGLEPLARDVLEGVSPEIDLATRATDFVRVDKNLNSIDEVIAGVADIVVERFAENSEARTKLRRVLWDKGVLKTTKVQTESSESAAATNTETTPPAESTSTESSQEPTETPATTPDSQIDESSATETIDESSTPETVAEVPSADTSSDQTPAAPETSTSETSETAGAESVAADSTESSDSDSSPTDSSTNDAVPEAQSAEEKADQTTAAENALDAPTSNAAPQQTTATATAVSTKAARPKKKKKKKKSKEDSLFEEFFDFSAPINKLTPQQILAINRGERAGKITVAFELPEQPLTEAVSQILVSGDPPFKPFLETCATTALQTQIIPSLEREVRRELTEEAEHHAIQVFERNLRVLLLQPPVRANKVMAIHPGYRAGCNIAILDAVGNFVAHDRFHIVGNQTRQDEGKSKIVELLRQHEIELVAIGNGSGCRATEKIISDIIAEHFSESHLKFVIVNEAGVTQYATSEVAREELPQLEPNVRSAVSIGRRLLNPLAEIAKIAPGNVAVGVFQHDVKSKHLTPFLENILKNCVNFVGVDVNTATASLLRYVAGLEPLTARRIVEYRSEHGPFKNLEQLKQIAGFGEATFIQAAGFLRVLGGDQPFDATSIHPESYELATKILEKIGCTSDDLPIRITTTTPAPSAADHPAAEEDQSADQEKPVDAATETAANESNDDSLAETATETSGAEQTSSEAPAALEETVETTAASGVETENVSSTDSPEASTESAGKDSESASQETESASAPAPTETSSSADGDDGQRQSIPPEVIAKQREFRDKLKSLRVDQMAKEFSVSQPFLKDLIFAMLRPGRDPRFDLPKPIFRKGLAKLEDIKAGMQLKAQILSVVDFGVFVDIGLGESCLIHISQLSRKFVRDPHRFFSVGDILNVWVTEVDADKKRVVMTAIRPAEHRKPPKPKQRSDRRGTRNQRSSNAGANRDRPRAPRKPKKPRPVKPITQSMVDGEEPMRSFSDLAQFFKINKDSEDKS